MAPDYMQNMLNFQATLIHAIYNQLLVETFR